MKKMKIESVNAKRNTASYAGFFYAVSYQMAAIYAAALFWSVFGPAVQYWFENSSLAYATASVKPYRP